MLKKQNRITENKEFLKMFKTVRPYHTEHMVFRCAKRNPNKLLNNQNHNSSFLIRNSGLHSRFGFVVSNKIDKRAARRNGLKRRIRVVIEANLSNMADEYDIVIQVKQPFNYPYNYAQIRDEVSTGLKKISILKDE